MQFVSQRWLFELVYTANDTQNNAKVMACVCRSFRKKFYVAQVQLISFRSMRDARTESLESVEVLLGSEVGLCKRDSLCDALDLFVDPLSNKTAVWAKCSLCTAYNLSKTRVLELILNQIYILSDFYHDGCPETFSEFLRNGSVEFGIDEHTTLEDYLCTNRPARDDLVRIFKDGEIELDENVIQAHRSFFAQLHTHIWLGLCSDDVSHRYPLTYIEFCSNLFNKTDLSIAPFP